MDERRALLDWYGRERRLLPWRATRDPWAIWVSEVMLQQTRVEVVVPYFERFLARFPAPSALAAASEEEALAHWSGLGYYRRVRQLRAAAIAVVAAGGALPASAAELERLPGIGPYTAAAIASIAFDEPVAVLDGNVARVMARRSATQELPSIARVRRGLLELAADLLEPSRPGDSNQALMELGATICTPRKPLCGRCPVAAGCAAFARGLVELIPARRVRTEPQRVHQTAALVRDGRERWLLIRRPAAAEILPGLWEPPTLSGAEPDPACFAARFGGRWIFAALPVASIRHTITYRRIELALWPADWQPSEVAEGVEARWLDPAADESVALTGSTRKLLRRLRSAG